MVKRKKFELDLSEVERRDVVLIINMFAKQATKAGWKKEEIDNVLIEAEAKTRFSLWLKVLKKYTIKKDE